MSALLLCGWSAGAAETTEYSQFERQVIAEALLQFDAVLDPQPEGKLIERIDVVTLEVFDDRDPVPNFVNVFHTTSRPHVIKRALLVREGSVYEASRIRESARSLRAIRQISLALIVACKGSAPDRVRLIVITKDVWSLRMNSDFEFGESGLTYLLLNPSEENVAGLHTSIGGLFILQPDNYSVGLLASQQRIFGSRIGTSASAHFLFNRDSGDFEGSWGGLAYGQPMYSLNTRWAWMMRVAWLREITRWHRGASVSTYDAAVTPGFDDAIPEVYRTNAADAGYELTRSFGHMYKVNLSVGVEAELGQYIAQAAPDASEAAFAEFERTIVPVSDTRWGPYFQLQAFTGRFITGLDMETLGLQEDFRLGHDVLLRVYPASKALGSTRDSIGIQVGLGYTLAVADALVRAVAASSIEYRSGDEHDAVAELRLRIYSPSLGFGRLVYDGALINRYRDFLNAPPYVLGGGSRLRGHPEAAYRGDDLFVHNFEFRSRSVNILSAELGFAVFYDAGDAVDRLSELHMKQGAGAGLRIMFPQANRYVFRADWAFPIADERLSSFPGRPFVTFEQAFGVPGLSSGSVASTGR